MRPILTYPLNWLAVVCIALVLAVVTPRERHAVGRLPAVVGQTVAQTPAARAGRDAPILALITFNRNQRQEAESWIDGLQLQHDQSITWIRMPVVHDSGEPGRRAAAEGRLMARYASASERANLVPVFIDRAVFAQSVGLRDTDQAQVLVLNRKGEVLARLAGGYDPAKAWVVRDTLAIHDL